MPSTFPSVDMHLLAVPYRVSLDHPCCPRTSPCPPTTSNPSFKIGSKALAASSKPASLLKFRFQAVSSNPRCSTSPIAQGEEHADFSLVDEVGDGGVFVQIQNVGRNVRRIRSRVAIQADLHTVWNVLTDYERLVEFIPGLAVSRVLEKKHNFARLFQIGQQKFPFGLKFNAKGIMDCYEKDLQSLPNGQQRDIEFKMIQGDFQNFQGKWSIQQCNAGGGCEGSDSLMGQQFDTTLAYIVDVKPKMWLPIHLVEGRLSNEIKLNLSCIREEAMNAIHNSAS